VDGALAAVSSETADAAVYDEPILRYHLVKYSNRKLRLVGNIFEEQAYGFAVQVGSPYRKQIDQILLELVENKTLETLNKKWFGEIAGGGGENR
jgi:ABC-type amino acid transport substrate-binding protein